MTTYIYFVRHGIAPFSHELERAGGASLSEQGKADAIRVAELLGNENIDVLVSSSYHRAKETITPLAELLKQEIIQYDELIERPIASLNYPIPEEQFLLGIEKSFTDLDFCMPEGETTRQAQERAIPVILKLLSDYAGKKIVIGTHGNIMTIILKYFDSSYGFEFWKQTSKPDIYKLEFKDKELGSVERLWR
ncbi:histidine phosphatase family protein [Paenibacillus chondroitinus]|uniref:Histidine phosphatase family protein n=1 Tax=Paenibacillus chondroitinus TaxID=59842 RepID=A0ABU6DME0_9BACL|nr:MULTISPECIES: histidine phosphatase family protein [Paenibacillus]MCY9660682.1 histidine phosphatase family protein [Paenibacillus anseongense]MEB4798138.1 histidine phosphatase family protein [Paenibacillus chondroitinus]